MQIMLMYLRLEEGAVTPVACRARGAEISRLRARARKLAGGREHGLSRAYSPLPRTFTRIPQEHNRDYLFSELGADDGAAADAGGAGAGAGGMAE
jgi:hypothetical protein